MEYKFQKIFLNILLLLISSAICIVLLELITRFTIDENTFLPYHANTTYYMHPSPDITPGVSGVSVFTTNSFGLRGPPLQDEAYRILTIGGSTTSDDVLDDTETWSYQLMKFLNTNASSSDIVWVGSSGIAGKHSEHHVVHATYLLPILPKLDWVILHAGINDLGRWLYAKSFDATPIMEKDQDELENIIAQSFRVSIYTADDTPLYKRSAIWRLASIAKVSVINLLSNQDDSGVIHMDKKLNWMEEQRERREERRKKFVIRAKLDSLPEALFVFAENLRQFANLVRENGAEPIFVAQVMPDFQSMTQEERNRFWMGAMDGGNSYVEESQYKRLLQLHNSKMKEVAIDAEVHFIDLAELVGDDISLFYDNMHYNERGAKMVGEAIGRYMQEQIFNSLPH